MTLGERIKQLRKQHGMTQVDLANQLEVTKGTVSTWETNSRKPSFDTLNQMCWKFDVSLDYLMGRSDMRLLKYLPTMNLNHLLCHLLKRT